MNSNVSTSSGSIHQGNIVYDNIARVYEDKLKEIIIKLSMLSEASNGEVFTEIQRDVENKLIEFDKLVDEECMNRILDSHKLNLGYITKLKEYRYDFSRENVSLDTLAKNTAKMFTKIDLNN
jgi:hypothetical protein